MKLFKGILLVAVVIIGFVFIANILAVAVPNYLTAREAHTFVDEGYSFSTAPRIVYHQSNPISYWFALLVGLLNCLVFALLTMAIIKNRRKAANPITINENDALRELMRAQDRMEQRITNLETILLSRTHTGVPNDKY